jgi:hypothetical protein
MASHWSFGHLQRKLWAKEGPRVKLALKVRNQPALDVRWGSATRRWKALKKGYKFGLDLVSIGGQGEKLGCPKIMGVQNQDSFGTPLWESWEKVPFECKCGGKAQRIL